MMKLNKCNSKNLFRSMAIGVLLTVVSACGGGGNTSSTVTPPPPVNTSSSNWDSLIWDQDNWG